MEDEIRRQGKKRVTHVIVYPVCASKTSVLRQHLQPCHIFITKTSRGKSSTKTLDNVEEHHEKNDG